MSAVLDGSAPPSVTADRSDEVPSIALTATKAAQELAWKPRVDLAEGIRWTIRWLCATLDPEQALASSAISCYRAVTTYRLCSIPHP